MVVCFQCILNGFCGQFQDDRVKWSFGAVGPLFDVEFRRPGRGVGIAQQTLYRFRSGENELDNRRNKSHLKYLARFPPVANRSWFVK